VKRGEIAQARMAALARDIESPVLGVNYRGLVKTVNVKFLDARKRVDDETMVRHFTDGDHRNQRIAITENDRWRSRERRRR
jgi:hypothetical protein